MVPSTKTTKTFFVVLVLLNFFASFFHLYYSREIDVKKDIHIEGDIIVYNSPNNIEGTIISENDDSKVIHLEGNVVLYDLLAHQSIGKHKEYRENKKKKFVWVKSKPKKFNSQKSKTFINCLDFNSNFILTSHASNNLALNTYDFNTKFAVKETLNTTISLLCLSENKLSNKLFSENKKSSFFKRCFCRPPPINLS